MTESVVEQAAFTWLEAACWHIIHGPYVAPDMTAAWRNAMTTERFFWHNTSVNSLLRFSPATNAWAWCGTP